MKKDREFFRLKHFGMLLTGFLLMSWPVRAQLYPTEREQEARLRIGDLLANYKSMLNCVGSINEDAEERQLYFTPEFEKLFAKNETLVFNDIEPDRKSGNELPVNRYSVNHIIWFPKTGVINTLNEKETVYSPIQKTANGSLYINAYVRKKVEGEFRSGIRHTTTNWLEFKVGFTDRGKFFSGYKIVGIRKIDGPPGAETAKPEAPKTVVSLTKSAADEPAERLLNALTTVTQELIRDGLIEGQRVRLEKFTYRTTGMGSQFSKVLNAYLSAKLTEQAKVKLLQPGNEPAPENTKAKRTKPGRVPADSTDWVVSGTYSDEGGTLQLLPTLQSIKANRTTSLSPQTLPLADVADLKVTLQPDNFDQAVATRKQLQTGAVANDFEVDILTNRGKNNVTFTDGDSLKLYVKAARPCFIRLTYHTADGQRILLFDNYYIDSLHVDTYLKILQKFTVSSPFGAETLQLNAATHAFPALQIRTEDGLDFINDDIATINQKNRQAEAGKAVKRSEKQLVVTMTPKLRQ